MGRNKKEHQESILRKANPGPLTGAMFFRIFGFALIFTLYTGVLLWSTDHVLLRILPDYQFSGKYEVGLAFFFIVAMIFTLFGRSRGWLNWRFYVFGGLAVFFPLTFLASSVTILIAPENVLIETNKALYCPSGDITTLCGEALAAVVFGMSLRALPAVLTLPPIYWYFAVYRPTLKRRV